MQQNHKRPIWFLLAACALLVLAGCGDQTESGGEQTEGGDGNTPQMSISPIDFDVEDDKVIADYEGGQVQAGEFEHYMNVQAFMSPQYASAFQQPKMWENMLKGYIAERLLLDRVSENGEDTGGENQQDVQKTLEQIKQMNQMVLGGEEKVDQAMEELQISDEDLTNYLNRSNQIRSYLQSQVSEEEIQKLYEEKKQEGAYKVVSVRHILLRTQGEDSQYSEEQAQELASELTQQIRDGGDFAELAQEYSEDPGSKDNGGLYENVQKSGRTGYQNWAPAFKEKAMNLEIGKVSDPVKTSMGYHVMRVEDRGDQSFEEVKSQVTSTAMNQKYQKVVEEEVENKIQNLDVPENLKS